MQTLPERYGKKLRPQTAIWSEWCSVDRLHASINNTGTPLSENCEIQRQIAKYQQFANKYLKKNIIDLMIEL